MLGATKPVLLAEVLVTLKFRVSLFAMTFYEKYPQLQEKAFLTQMLTETVFTTMSLEDQQVPKDKVQKIVVSLLSDEELERAKLNGNQVS
jgi:hypothetical protein